MAYATYAELEARWRPLTEQERTRATALLDSAAVYLDALVEVDPKDERQAAALKEVSLSMVQRAMVASESDAFGVEKQTISADIYSQSTTFSNPGGDLYLTQLEKRILGITGGYMLSVRPTIAPVEVRMNDHPWRDR